MLLLWYFVVQNHHVLWCKKVPKKDCYCCGILLYKLTMSYGARKYPRKIVLVVWKASLLTGYVPHFVPLPMQPMRRLSIGTLSSHKGSSSPLFPMLFSSCSHGCSQKVPQAFLSCSPPPPRHSFPTYAKIFATYT
jgi:hypothetical protein